MWIKAGSAGEIRIPPARTFTIFALKKSAVRRRVFDFQPQAQTIWPTSGIPDRQTDRLAIVAALGNRFFFSSRGFSDGGYLTCCRNCDGRTRRWAGVPPPPASLQVRNITRGSSCGPLLRTCGPGYELA